MIEYSSTGKWTAGRSGRGCGVKGRAGGACGWIELAKDISNSVGVTEGEIVREANGTGPVLSIVLDRLRLSEPIGRVLQ